MTNKGCLGCVYAVRHNWWTECSYIEKEKKSRVAQGALTRPGGGCALKKTQKCRRSRWPKPPVVSDEDRNRWREMYEQGMSDQRIAETCGVPKSRVQRWRSDEGLESPTQARLRVRDAAFRHYYDLGYSDGAIAGATDSTTDNVYNWRKRKGLPANFPRGSRRKGDSYG